MLKKNFISEYLSTESLEKISSSIGEIEKNTSGELRLCIKKRRGFLEKNLTPREIALKEFFKLKMDKTSDKTGVLFFIIFEEHKFEIIADEGLNTKISGEMWNTISNEIKISFTKEDYLEGILKALKRVGVTLISEFPVKPGDKNELSDDVILKR
ncbi:MAG: TPM domain-containing protein [Ignavibacteria bacterium]